MPLKLKKVASKDGKSYTWHITGSLQGIRCRESTGTASRVDAERMLAKRQRDILDGATLDPRQYFTVGDAFLHYIQHGGERRFILPLNEAFGEIKVKDLTAKHLTDYVSENLSNRKGSYIARIVYDPINAAINKSARAQLCEPRTFPAPKFKVTSSPNAPDEWIAHMILSVNPRLQALMLFTTYTGCRCGEALTLMPENIDWQSNRVVINETKTGNKRLVKLHPDIVVAMRSLDLKQGQRIFGYSDQRSVNQAVRRFCARNDLDYYTTHQWGRKAFATRHLVIGGKSLKWVADAGGWASTRMVSQHYAHLEQSVIDDGMVDIKIQGPDKLLTSGNSGQTSARDKNDKNP